MTTHYNATMLLDRRIPARGDHEWTDRVIEALAGFGPVVSRLSTGQAELIITVPADNLRGAITTALALARDATGVEALGLEVITTAEFDRREGLAPMPELLSVTQAATRLGVSRQAVLQRLDAGTLSGERVGATWAIPAAAVELLAASQARASVEGPA